MEIDAGSVEFSLGLAMAHKSNRSDTKVRHGTPSFMSLRKNFCMGVFK